jgi:hypothetical protein
MTTQALRGWQLVASLVACLLASGAVAETVSGLIRFPGRSLPATVLYLRNLDSGALHPLALRRGETEFSIEVPAGRYWVFVRPDEPGLAGLYGGHTQYSLCSHAKADGATTPCEDHALAEVLVGSGAGVTRVEVDDWLLSDASASEIDRILGNAPGMIDSSELGRPRFSEYRVARVATPPPQVDVASDPRAAALASQLQAAAAGGSNFAGRFTLYRSNCGDRCEQVILIDQSSGTVSFPEQLSQLSSDLPCRSERALEFRDDSRLLEWTRREGEFVITDSLLWDVDKRVFTPLAQYRRSLERFCAGTTPAP